MSELGEASTDDKVMRLKLLIDKTRNKVIFAESDFNFVDTLLSFMTFPLGTAIKLVGPGSTQIGSINGIYGSVLAMDPLLFQTVFVKEMLLNPRNASEIQCSDLKINVNIPMEPTKFYMCLESDCMDHMSTFPNARCVKGHMLRKVNITHNRVKPEDHEGVFVNGCVTRFMITDDLQVMSGSTASCILLLNKFGINDWNEVEERTVEIKQEEVLRLLKFSLVSKSPLTEAFLSNQGSSIVAAAADAVEFEQKKSAQNEKTAMAKSIAVRLKLVFSKTKKSVLYAEAGVDMVEFLVSFLTFPLGSIVKLLCRNSSLGHIDNLYQSAEELSTANIIKSEEHKKILVSPKIAPFFSYENQPFQIEEALHPQYFLAYNTHGGCKIRLATDADRNSSSESDKFIDITDPKSSAEEETVESKRFMTGLDVFMITDDLIVAPLSPFSSIAIFKQLNVAVDDVDELMVTMGNDEALKLLKASLHSKTALSDVFFPMGILPGSDVDIFLKTCKKCNYT